MGSQSTFAAGAAVMDKGRVCPVSPVSPGRRTASQTPATTNSDSASNAEQMGFKVDLRK